MDENPYRSPLQPSAPPDRWNAGLFAFLSRVFDSILQVMQVGVAVFLILVGLVVLVGGGLNAPGVRGKAAAIAIGFCLCWVGCGLIFKAVRYFRALGDDSEISEIEPNNPPPDAF